MKLDVSCRECNNQFEINGNNVLEAEAEFVTGQHVILTYYDCPKCGYRHIVQVDNSETQEMLRKCKDYARRMAKKHKKGKVMQATQADEFSELRKAMNDKRVALMAELDGKVYFMANGSRYVAEMCQIGGGL